LPGVVAGANSRIITTLLLNQSLWMKDDLVSDAQSFCVSTIFSILVLSVAAIAFTRV